MTEFSAVWAYTPTLEDLRKAFSRDLAIMAESMKNAEQQFAMLESKAQAELKTARQGALKLEKENAVLRKSAKSDQERLGKVIATLQAKIAGLSESHGNLTGRLSGLSGQYKTACSRLKEAERKLAAPKAPARRTNKRVTNK